MSPPIVCGVYLLFREFELVYVGRSTDCYGRVAKHRSSGRAFDYALVTACPAEDAPWVEKALLRALEAKQNRQGVGVAPPPARRPQREPAAAAPDPLRALNLTEARKLAGSRGIPTNAVPRAVEAGELKSFARGALQTGKGATRTIRLSDFDRWCADYQSARLDQAGD